MLRRQRLWADLQADVKMLPTPETVGRVLALEEEEKLLRECARSRSRSLWTVIALALNTGMRLSEIRLLCWRSVDLVGKTITVGESKTAAGRGRVVPLNTRATAAMKAWRFRFPDRKPSHYVFPSERCGIAGDAEVPCVYDVDPTEPINSWKEAWEAAKRHAGLQIRFHDLRHTACTRMLEGGVPLSVVAALLGWSPATTARMVKRYGHISDSAQRGAVALLE